MGQQAPVGASVNSGDFSTSRFNPEYFTADFSMDILITTAIEVDS